MDARPHTRRINADTLKLALVARRARPGTRWAAMSDGAETQPCRTQPPGGGYVIRTDSRLVPMDRGYLVRCIERARRHHRWELQRTWGVGIRAIRAEVTSSYILRAGQ